MTFICDARERAGAFVLNDPCGSEYIELGNDENCLTRRRLMPDGGFLLPPAEPDMEKGIRAERSRRASAAPPRCRVSAVPFEVRTCFPSRPAGSK